MPRPKKTTEPIVEQPAPTTVPVEIPADSTSAQPVKIVETINISKADWDKMQEQIKMLTAVADKGRMFNYENQQQGAQKKPMKVKLSIYNNCYIIGWKTNKDELVKHPTTGLTVGEIQEYEVSLLSKDGQLSTALINGYPAFSNARYGERCECEVVGKSEDFAGNLEFDLLLPDGQKLKLSSRFIN